MQIKEMTRTQGMGVISNKYYYYYYYLLLTLKIIFGPNSSGIGRIDMSTQFEKAQAHENQPMKRFRDIYGVFKIFQSYQQGILRLCLKGKRWRRFFFLSHDMVDDMGSG